MTTEHTLLAAISTLLIAGLLIYLRQEFEQLTFQSRIDQNLMFYYDCDDRVWKNNQPKRRKYRDNK